MPSPKTATTQPGFFLYSRKSTESEDRQVLSIDSQIDEVKKLAERLGIRIVEVLRESRSAKAPGRPVFNEMMRRLYAGEAQGILCWKLDRLARNPVDGGSIIWAVKQHAIRIVTPTQSYSYDDDNIILMYIEFGMAHKYIDDLSRVVKRGLRAKAQQGWYPTVVPPGYLNQVNSKTGHKEIVKDPDRFDLVQRIWSLMLTGSYSPPKILRLANEDWGFRTRAGKPLSRSGLYYLLTNPFYTASFEYPLGSGQWFKGNHEPMITDAEYHQVQTLLGSKGRPRGIRRTFPYTGLLHCGACSAAVTAEDKHQLICSACRFKFARRGKDRCPRCQTSIDAMLDTPDRKPTILTYVYYHCTKRKQPRCDERALTESMLEKQLAAYLERIWVSARFQQWALERLRRSIHQEVEVRHATARAQEKAYTASVARLDNLLRLKTSPENADGSLVSAEEYSRQRAALLKEKARFEELLQGAGEPLIQRINVLDEVFDFARQAPTWLERQDPETKRLILAVFATDGSNLTLTNKTLRIDAPKPFPILEEYLSRLGPAPERFEPETIGMDRREKVALATSRPRRLGGLDDVRTYGEAGLQLVQRLREWLEATPADQLLALQGKLRALFEKVRAARRVA